MVNGRLLKTSFIKLSSFINLNHRKRTRNWKQKIRTANKVLPKAGLNGFDWTLVQGQHSFFDSCLVLKIPAFGNTRTVSPYFIKTKQDALLQWLREETRYLQDLHSDFCFGVYLALSMHCPACVSKTKYWLTSIFLQPCFIKNSKWSVCSSRYYSN